MKEDLLPYYEHELSLVRNMGKEFAKSYRKIAQRLLLESDTGASKDPHVERLIEAFAFIAGRIHHKIDDEFPEITEALLDVLYPHYLRPIPSMSIAQLQVDPDQAQLSSGYLVKANSQLYTRQIATKDVSCGFRTCYPVNLWPIEVIAASVRSAGSAPSSSGSSDAAVIIRIQLKCQGRFTFSGLKLDRMRFYLQGEGNVVDTLYELIFNNVLRVELCNPGPRSKAINVALPKDCIRPVGFSREEGMLPYLERSFIGYRLLQEYFAFPPKFLFFDVTGFDRIPRSSFEEIAEILIHIGSFERKQRLPQLEQTVNAGTFQLGCTPVVNLFDRLAEPIRLSYKATEYQVIPDIHRQASTEVYSINEVTSTAPYFESPREYVPFYSIRHSYSDEMAQGYWYASRRSSPSAGDRGTDVYLSLVNLKFEPTRPPDESLTVNVTCTNRDLAGELPISGAFGELSFESGSMVKARFLRIPTKSARPPLRRGLQWRLISHLGLNYLSIVKGGKEALQEILRLYDFNEDPAIRKQILAISDIDSTPHVARVISQNGIVFAQGMLVNIEFDEAEFVGAGVFLFASVLERFLGLYSSINSFSQLTVTTRQRKEVLRQWQPRSGEQILL